MVVDALHKVCAVLVGAVDAALELQGIDGVHVIGTHKVFKVPLYGVYPRFFPQNSLEGALQVGVVLGSIDVVSLMVFNYLLLKELVEFDCFAHCIN